MPQSIVASQPALQWVRTLTGSPGAFAAAISRMMPRPCPPIARQIATSSSQIRAARRYAAATRSARGYFRHAGYAAV